MNIGIILEFPFTFIDDDNDKVIVECDSSFEEFVEYFKTKGTQPLIYTTKDEETIKLGNLKHKI